MNSTTLTCSLKLKERNRKFPTSPRLRRTGRRTGTKLLLMMMVACATHLKSSETENVSLDHDVLGIILNRHIQTTTAFADMATDFTAPFTNYHRETVIASPNRYSGFQNTEFRFPNKEVHAVSPNGRCFLLKTLGGSDAEDRNGIVPLMWRLEINSDNTYQLHASHYGHQRPLDYEQFDCVIQNDGTIVNRWNLPAPSERFEVSTTGEIFFIKNDEPKWSMPYKQGAETTTHVCKDEWNGLKIIATGNKYSLESEITILNDNFERITKLPIPVRGLVTRFNHSGQEVFLHFGNVNYRLLLLNEAVELIGANLEPKQLLFLMYYKDALDDDERNLAAREYRFKKYGGLTLRATLKYLEIAIQKEISDKKKDAKLGNKNYHFSQITLDRVADFSSRICQKNGFSSRCRISNKGAF